MSLTVAFEVEDGTGSTGATSYVSTTEFRQYWFNKGVDYSSTATYPDATVETWLNEATILADSTHRWAGVISDDDQALLVPRIGWSDVYGRDLDDTVPVYLKNGVCELAGLRKGTDPDSIAVSGVASKSYGPVSVSYRSSGSDGKRSTSYPTAEAWFSKLGQERGLRNWPA